MLSKTDKYKVVINHEEQYSIIPIDQSLARGWREIGKSGTQTECIKYIEEVWTDMTPIDRERIIRSIGK
jgi:MbtH protein